MEERLMKTEKKLKKSQKWAAEGKSHSQAELQKAQAQISALRTDLSKMTEKLAEHECKPSSKKAQAHAHAQAQESSAKALTQRFNALLELATPNVLERSDLATLTQLHNVSIHKTQECAFIYGKHSLMVVRS